MMLNKRGTNTRIAATCLAIAGIALILAAGGCDRTREDALAKKLKTIVIETRALYNKSVNDLSSSQLTAQKSAATLEWFDDKIAEVRGLMEDAQSRSADGKDSRAAIYCLTTINYLTTIKETFRRLQSGDSGSGEMSLKLARVYYRKVIDFPERVSGRPPMTATPRATTEKPNVILIVTDTLRADQLGAYGQSRDTTPFLDSLADQGLLYENAFSQAPHTPASVATILTGTYPATHRLVSDCAWRSELSLAREFKKAGYSTAAFSANPIVSRENGYGEGFDMFAHHPEAIAEVLINDVYIWLYSLKDDAPVFVYLHLMDPHESYNAPAPYTQKYNPNHRRKFFTSWIYGALMYDIVYDFDPDKTGWIPEEKAYELIKKQKKADVSRRDIDDELDYYNAEIAYTDMALGKMFKELGSRGFLENAAVAFTSDHGEGFMEHGFMEHGNVLYDEMIHVPLILWDGGKNFKPGRISDIAESTDIMPSLLDIAGIQIPDSVEGRPLPAGTDGGHGNRIAFSSTWHGRSFKDKKEIHKFSARSLGHKLIYTPHNNLYELYDLEKDPEEKFNIMPPPGEPVPGGLMSALNDYYRRFDWWSDKTAKKNANPNLRKDMKTLGYIR